MQSRGDYAWWSAEGSRAVGVPSAARALLGSPRHSTTRSYRGDSSNRFRSICEDMATPGELFSDEILFCLDQEDSEKEPVLAASQQYESLNAPPTTTTENNSARASTTRPAPHPQQFLHTSLHRKRVKRYEKEDRIVYRPKQKRT